jgi:hypothetical protein
MMKLALAFSLVPSYALAHPGRHGGIMHDAASNPMLVILGTWYGTIALIVAVTYVAARITKRVRS